MATYTVKRSNWYRGQGTSGSRLLRVDGTRCCIGFVGEQCGIADEAMLNVGQICFVDGKSKSPKWFELGNADDLMQAYSLNDDNIVSDPQRETGLAAIFKKHGDTLVFVD